MSNWRRRKFLKFLGRAGVLGTAYTFIPLSGVSSCGNSSKSKSIFPSLADRLILAEGMAYHIVASWGDPINQKDSFGFNNDYTAFIPLSKTNHDDALLWVNHEYVSSLFVSGYSGGDKTRSQVDKEQYALGGSIIRIKKEGQHWKMQYDDPLNRRITAQTPIPFHWDEAIADSDGAIGTFGNCAGGVTPWGTILTCEENYDAFYGEIYYENNERRSTKGRLGWEKYYDRPPEHYGWVVEVDPMTGSAQKLVALGRFMHECATLYEGKDKRLVVYSGDDEAERCLYKFISSEPGSLKKGKLYVACLEEGLWKSLDINDDPRLKKKFKDQTEIQVRAREAAYIVGGTMLDRPEDIEIDPLTGHVLVSLTNNFPKGNYHGSILKITEKGGDHFALEFEHETFLSGGEETGFTCPDNMAFDPKGNLWFTSDIPGSLIGSNKYGSFGNNGLYYVPSGGSDAGKVIQMASAPVDAELTGPTFTPDGKTLFLSIQHPGERTTDINDCTSNWPDGGKAIPKPSVVAIQGPLLERIVNNG